MIGWHFTTPEFYAAALRDGLKPAPVHPQHYSEFAIVEEFIPDWKAVWVFCNRQFYDQLLGMLIFTMAQHGSARSCLLKLTYPTAHSCRRMAEIKEQGSAYKLTHTLTIAKTVSLATIKSRLTL